MRVRFDTPIGAPLNRKPSAPRSRAVPSRTARIRLGGTFADACARGLALFFGLFSLANSVGWLLNGPHHEDIWWIDLSALPRWLAVGFGVAAASLLVSWAIRPSASRIRRFWTVLVCVALSIAAALNAVAFYQVWHAGRIAPGMMFPASLLYAAVFAWLARRVSGAERTRARANLVGVAAVVVALAVAFPLVQMVFFGTTDYRRPADAAVVLGAKVNANGSLSTALEDRVRTGVDLYQEGLVQHLIMSGGVGESGADEGLAMRRRAMELGVPDAAIVVDHLGLNTDATVAQTAPMLDSLGARRVLVVSQFWHLPRIKLAYLKSGWNVGTVPAGTSSPITQTPYLMAREIPAFWKYWVRSI